VDEIRARLDERIAELAPLVGEYEQLMRLRSQLDDQPIARPRGSRHGTRAEQSLALVAARPGITTNDIAGEMGIDRNYLYRVLPRLEKEGRLTRRDGGWHVAGPGRRA
jgi:DNA-binding MarR family transcriptional regulator